MISVVVPVYNEAESVETLYAELDGVFSAHGLGDAEFVFIDDGSRDATWPRLRALAGRDPRVRAVRFRRNFGKAAALTAGFQMVRGDVVLTLDGDLQDDPAEIPRFLSRLGQDLDVVSGWKRRRRDPWHKVYPSRVFNWMVTSLTGCRLHDHNCGFKAYRSEVLKEVALYGELHRFVPVLAHARGFRVGEIEVNHRARKFGASKYGVARFVKGLLDLLTVRFLTRFGQRPLHLMGAFGLVLLTLGGLGLVYLAVLWVLGFRPIGDRPLLVYSVALLTVGTQLLSLGVLAELVTSYNIRAEDTYSIAETVGTATAPEPPPSGNAGAPLAMNPNHDQETPDAPARSQPRQFFALIVIGAAASMALGETLKVPTQLTANDISRWCTVWSLLERGTFAIDECPWQKTTQDKVKKPDKLAAPEAGSGPLKRLEYALAPRSWKEGDAVERFYSSKPPLLPTMIAGILYPFRRLTHVPLGKVFDQPREPRYVQKDVEDEPGKTEFVLETPKEPVKWPVYVFYFKPVLVLLNVVPMVSFLVLYARLLDRVAGSDWSWFLCLFSASAGTYLFVYVQTLNNHTVAAWSAFFAVYALQRVWSGGDRSPACFAAAGFFGAFCACNELPAAIFGVVLFLMLLARFPGPTLKFFVPAAAVPCAAFLATQYLSFGQFRPVYEEFGTKSYEYAGSYWTTPLELDLFNKPEYQEPYPVYLFHMTFGHHGVFSLTPIFLFSLYGACREIVRRGKLSAVAWLTLVLTAAMLAFYTWNPKARNYGGSAQGLRWLFWLIPFWLTLLPAGVEAGQRSRLVRWLSLTALLTSVFSVGYAFRSPWSHPWILDAMEHLKLYELKR